MGIHDFILSSEGGASGCLVPFGIFCGIVAGAAGGCVIGNKVADHKKIETINKMVGIKEEMTEQEKVNKWKNKYHITKKQPSNNDNKIVLHNSEVDYNNNKNGLSDQEWREFVNNPDIYGSGVDGWWNLCCKKEPMYEIEPVNVKDKEQSDNLIINNYKNSEEIFDDKKTDKGNLYLNIKKNKYNTETRIHEKEKEKEKKIINNIVSNENEGSKNIITESDINSDNKHIIIDNKNNENKEQGKVFIQHGTQIDISDEWAKYRIDSVLNWMQKQKNIDKNIIFAFFEKINLLTDEEVEGLLNNDGDKNIFNFIVKVFETVGAEQIPPKLRLLIIDKIISDPEVFFFSDKKKKDNNNDDNEEKEEEGEEEEDDEDLNNDKEGQDLDEKKTKLFLALLPCCIEELNEEKLKDADPEALKKLFFIMVRMINRKQIDIHGKNDEINDEIPGEANKPSKEEEQSLLMFCSKLLQHYVDCNDLPKFDGDDAIDNEKRFYRNLLLLTIRHYSDIQALPDINEGADGENFKHFIELILNKVMDDISSLQDEQRDKLFTILLRFYIKNKGAFPDVKDSLNLENDESEINNKIDENGIEELKKQNTNYDKFFIQLFEEYIKKGYFPDGFWGIITDFLKSKIDKKKELPKDCIEMLLTIWKSNIQLKISDSLWQQFMEYVKKKGIEVPDNFKIKTTVTIKEKPNKFEDLESDNNTFMKDNKEKARNNLTIKGKKHQFGILQANNNDEDEEKKNHFIIDGEKPGANNEISEPQNVTYNAEKREVKLEEESIENFNLTYNGSRSFKGPLEMAEKESELDIQAGKSKNVSVNNNKITKGNEITILRKKPKVNNENFKAEHFTIKTSQKNNNKKNIKKTNNKQNIKNDVRIVASTNKTSSGAFGGKKGGTLKNLCYNQNIWYQDISGNHITFWRARNDLDTRKTQKIDGSKEILRDNRAIPKKYLYFDGITTYNKSYNEYSGNIRDSLNSNTGTHTGYGRKRTDITKY